MAVWTYSDWVTYADTDVSSKITRLRLHVQEVSDKLTDPSYSTEGLSVSKRDGLDGYLAGLKAELKELEALDVTARVGWTRGHASL